MDAKIMDDILLGKKKLDDKSRRASPAMKRVTMPEKFIDDSSSNSKSFIKIVEG